VARSYRYRSSARALSDELTPFDLWTSAASGRRKVKAIRFDAFTAEVLALPCSYRRRVAVVLHELAGVPGVRTTAHIYHIHIYLWLNAQHEERRRYCTVILGLLEVVEAIAFYAIARGYLERSPFISDPPTRWFPNGTFHPRRRYCDECHCDRCECKAPPRPAPAPLILGGPDDEPIVFGVPKPRLSFSQYNAVRTVRDHPGLTVDGLDEKSGHPDTRTILRKLRKGDPEWTAAIIFPGRNGRGGYRIAARR
jgi:hypothetical protein